MRLFSLAVSLAFVASCGGGGSGGSKDAGQDSGSIKQDMGSTPQAAIGAPCKKSNDCGSGETCLINEASSGFNFPKGYCTKSCATNGTPDCQAMDTTSTC